MRQLSHWSDFFRDARDSFSAFTVISLLAGLTLVSAPLVCRLLGWPLLTRDETASTTFVYCISALSDALLGIYLNKMPNALNVASGENSTIQQAAGNEAGSVSLE